MLDRRPEDMYGSLPGELIGEPVESLVPDGLRSVHISQRAEYAQHPTVRPMAARVRLAGRRKDRSTFPVRVSLSPVLTATGHLILAVVRDVTEDLPTPTWATSPGGAAWPAPPARGRAGAGMDVDVFEVPRRERAWSRGGDDE